MSYIGGFTPQSELCLLCKKHGCTVFFDCDLKEYTTFKIGGSCRMLISVNSRDCIVDLVKYINANDVKYEIIGRGSNIIASDEGYDGVILCIGNDLSGITLDGNTITCKSGTLLAAACVFARENGLSGMENLFGIPGTVGGAVYMNAGAYRSEIADIAISAEYVDSCGNIYFHNFTRGDFAYRKSIFVNSGHIITEVTFKLIPDCSDDIRLRMNECMARRVSKQPLDYPSAGSSFKRPEGSYASLLIDQCGLKGMTVGGAAVSEKHSGFVINKGNATCADVLELCARVTEIVREKTGYQLELEPVILKSSN